MGMDLHLTATLIISLLQVSQVLSQDHHVEECAVWENVTRLAERTPGVNMGCMKEADCTGFHCNGEYVGTYFDEDIAVNFCYGVEIWQCHHPLAIHYYISSPGHQDFEDTITNSTVRQLAGFHYDAPVNADAFVVINMDDSQSYHNHRYVELEVILKVRVTAVWELWPQQLQRTLMPKTLIPVPPCDEAHSEHTETPTHRCLQYTTVTSTTTTITPATGSASGNVTNKPVITGKACQANVFHACEHNEECVDNVCVCMEDFTMVNSVGCVPVKGTSIPVIPVPHVDVLPTKSSGGKNTVIISVCVVGIAVIIAAIVGVFIFRYKRHQARYGQHELLLNGDDDPVDDST